MLGLFLPGLFLYSLFWFRAVSVWGTHTTEFIAIDKLLDQEKYEKHAWRHYGRAFQKVNEKVNLRRPNACWDDITILKDRFLKNPSKIQFWLHKLSASWAISTYQRKS